MEFLKTVLECGHTKATVFSPLLEHPVFGLRQLLLLVHLATWCKFFALLMPSNVYQNRAKRRDCCFDMCVESCQSPIQHKQNHTISKDAHKKLPPLTKKLESLPSSSSSSMLPSSTWSSILSFWIARIEQKHLVHLNAPTASQVRVFLCAFPPDFHLQCPSHFFFSAHIV